MGKHSMQKEAGVAILVSEKKIDTKSNIVTRERKGYYIMIKGSFTESI